jgi:hypothetical protein
VVYQKLIKMSDNQVGAKLEGEQAAAFQALLAVEKSKWEEETGQRISTLQSEYMKVMAESVEKERVLLNQKNASEINSLTIKLQEMAKQYETDLTDAVKAEQQRAAESLDRQRKVDAKRTEDEAKTVSEAAEETLRKIKATYEETLAQERLATKQRHDAEVVALTELKAKETAEKTKFSEKIHALEDQVTSLRENLKEKTEQVVGLGATIATLQKAG